MRPVVVGSVTIVTVEVIVFWKLAFSQPLCDRDASVYGLGTSSDPIYDSVSW